MDCEAALSLSGGDGARSFPRGRVAPYWESDSSVPAGPARPVRPRSAATALAPPLPVAVERWAAAAPAAGLHSPPGRRRQSERRPHNRYNIRTDSPCAPPETCSCVEKYRCGSRRRDLRTLPPTRRRPASPRLPIETGSCAVPLSQSSQNGSKRRVLRGQLDDAAVRDAIMRQEQRSGKPPRGRKKIYEVCRMDLTSVIGFVAVPRTDGPHFSRRARRSAGRDKKREASPKGHASALWGTADARPA